MFFMGMRNDSMRRNNFAKSIWLTKRTQTHSSIKNKPCLPNVVRIVSNKLGEVVRDSDEAFLNLSVPSTKHFFLNF